MYTRLVLLLSILTLMVITGQAQLATAVASQTPAATPPPVTMQMVKDIMPGASGSDPDDFFNVNGILYFSAFDDAHGFELWRSDGTPTGTYMVADINPGLDHSHPTGMVAYSGYFNDSDFYFLARTDSSQPHQIWKSDGTAAGTVQAVAPVDTPRSLTVVGDTLYFFANDPLYGVELWANNGTYGGSWLVKDINPGSANGADITQRPVALGNKLLFIANDGVHGIELWISDGTTAGTHLVKDIYPDSSNIGAWGYFVVWGGLAYFNGNDNQFGGELWQTDGTSAGTVRVAAVSSSTGTPIDILGVSGGLLYFLGNSPAQLWVADGTDSGTRMVHDFSIQVQYGSSLGATPFNNGYCFSYIGNRYDTGSFRELWCSDGQTAVQLDIIPASDEEIWSAPAVLNDILYFAVEDDVHGVELWQSDGAVAGSQMVQDINPAQYVGSVPGDLTVVNGRLFFVADDGTHGRELWLLSPSIQPPGQTNAYLPMIIR
ncbi:MAG: hypothetical protein IAE79_09625 [Anaerolinea sp.]|nr:hypothetical protein [Anaerolinea sp.]